MLWPRGSGPGSSQRGRRGRAHLCSLADRVPCPGGRTATGAPTWRCGTSRARSGHRARPGLLGDAHSRRRRRGLAQVGERLASFEHDGRTFWHTRGDRHHGSARDAGGASAAALAACRAASLVASLAARWASAAAVRCRRERGAPPAKTRAASIAAAGRRSPGRALRNRTSAGSAHATAYPAIARSSSIVSSKSPERVCICSSFPQRARRPPGARRRTEMWAVPTLGIPPDRARTWTR